jgi:hypothetical protein
MFESRKSPTLRKKSVGKPEVGASHPKNLWFCETMAAVGAFVRRVPRRSFVAIASGDNGIDLLFKPFLGFQPDMFIFAFFFSLFFFFLSSVSTLGANEVALKMLASPITGKKKEHMEERI